MLLIEAIRLGLQQEQHHESIDTWHHAAASTHARGHAPAQARAQDADLLRACRTQAGRVSRPFARHRHGRGSAALPVASGRPGHFADHAQRNAHGIEVLLRRHAGSRGVDGQDEFGARAADAAGGAQSRGGRTPDRRGHQPQAPDGVDGGLRRRTARRRGHRAEGRRHRQPAHDAARRTGQGPQGPLRHALAVAAGASSRVVARRACPGQDLPQGLAVPRARSDGSVDRPATQPRHPCRRQCRRASTSA